MQERTMIAVLAALLHDLGKFWQRAGRPGPHYEASAAFVDEFDNLFPYDWKDDIRDGAGNHHRPPRKEVEKIVKVADWLASAEREREPDIPRQDPDQTPLIPILSRLSLLEPMSYNSQQADWRYRLKPLALTPEAVFPFQGVQVSRDDYATLWEGFAGEVRRLPQLNTPWKLVSFLAVLRKYAAFIPSATPWEEDEEYRTLPDISLYDHLKVTAAIAACLDKLLPDHLDTLLKRERQKEPVCLMVRGDISGIQGFIYRITRPETEKKGTARRLRGRSFYLALLTEVIADWLIRELGLPATNILFCGGGRFDLLVPIDPQTQDRLQGLIKTLQKWLLETFYGELGIQMANVPVKPGNFQDLEGIYNALDEALSERKRQKFDQVVGEPGFFTPQEALYHVCRVCGITPLPDPGICQLCDDHAEIGSLLPKAAYLAWVYGDPSSLLPDQRPSSFPQFGIATRLLDQASAEHLVQRMAMTSPPVVLYRLNCTEFIIPNAPPNLAVGFKFLGNEAPIARRTWRASPLKEPVQQGEILDFEEIAALSAGAKLLGVLKADVDRLGLLFGIGLTDKSISRLATLSTSLDLFFTGWLNKICREISREWNDQLPDDDRRVGVTDEIFYIVYSGGDDLLILGPWDQILELAQRLYTEFQAYACLNPNVTLSAGILLVKPHFPIHRFAKLVGDELDESKNRGRNRITLFGETVSWYENRKGFDELMKFGKALVAKVEADELPKSFVYFLLNLRKRHARDNGLAITWVPEFRYMLARRVSKEVRTDPKLDLLGNVPAMMEHIRIPVSYVSLKTREE